MIALALLLALLAPVAGASEQPADRPFIRESLAAAEVYWGRPLPLGTTVVYADPMPPLCADSRMMACADLSGTHIWLRADWRSPVGDGTVACKLLVHEVGHLFGYTHTASGVMAPYPGDARVPACDWAKALDAAVTRRDHPHRTCARQRRRWHHARGKRRRARARRALRRCKTRVG